MKSIKYLAVAAAVIVAAHASAEEGEARKMPPPADIEVDYNEHIKPIFDKFCLECHNETKQKSKLRLDTRELALEGGIEGPAFVPGNSEESLIIELLLGTNPYYQQMPPQDEYRELTDEEIGLIRAWIDQGAEYPEPTMEVKETAQVEGLPKSWKVQATKQDGPLASWEIMKKKGPDGGTLIGLTAANHENADSVNLLWTAEAGFQNGSIAAKLYPLGGDHAKGGGVLWRAKDKQNYYAAIVDAKNNKLRLLAAKDGEIKEITAADFEKSGEPWISLSISHSGEKITGVVNGKQVLETTDATHSDPGGIGYATQGDAAAAFTAVDLEKE